METKFQTSFIPKKPISPAGGFAGGTSSMPRPHKTSSLFMTLATLLFIVSLAAAGGMYFWKSTLLNAQETYKTELAAQEKRFNTNQIEELKRQDVKITLAQQLLNNHIAASQIFNIIGLMTIEKVRFQSMDLSTGATPGEDVKVTLKGYGTSFKAVAWQSDVLGKLDQYGLRNIVKNPILSDPSLNSNDAVSFGFSATVNPKNLSYQNDMTPSTDSSGSTPTNTTPPTP